MSVTVSGKCRRDAALAAAWATLLVVWRAVHLPVSGSGPASRKITPLWGTITIHDAGRDGRFLPPNAEHGLGNR